jgi:NodT family efflux transporter outer membrane factor (OMF) lipoprotein
MIQKFIRVPFLGASLLVSACLVGPSYHRPSAPMPVAAPPEGFKPAEPRDNLLKGDWWEIFGDPSLSALEAQVNVSNQNIAQSEALFRQARAVARGARSALFPTLSLAPSVTRSHGTASTSALSTGSTPVTATEYELPLDFSYEIDLWGAARRGLESGVAQAQAAAADLETMRLSMHAELAVDYFELRGVDAQKATLDRTVDAEEKALQLTINRHDQGIASGVDVAQAQTELDTTRVQATDLGISRAQLQHAIAILIGRPPQDFSLDPVPLAAVPPPVPDVLASELLERRPDIAGAERRVKAANAQIGVATAAYYPSLSLSATGGYAAFSLTNLISLPNRFWSVGAALAELLFDGGKRRAGLEQAEAAYDATVAAYRQQVLSAFGDVEDNLAALRILADEARQQTEAVDAAHHSLQLSEDRYRGGIATYLEVVTAQTAALTAERSQVDTETRRMTACVNLVKAVGGGWQAGDLPTSSQILSRVHRPSDPAARPSKD